MIDNKIKAHSKICDLKLGKHVSINFVLVEYYKILEYMKFMLLYKFFEMIKK